MGFFDPAGGETAEGIALPLIESATQQIASPSDRPAPAAVALVAPAWQPRNVLAGSYDEAWKANRAPLYAHDYDARFADPGSVVTRPRLRGGEPIELLNLGIPDRYAATVPRPTSRIRIGSDEYAPVIDSLHIDPAADTISLSLRLDLPTERNIMQAPPYLVRAAIHPAWDGALNLVVLAAACRTSVGRDLAETRASVDTRLRRFRRAPFVDLDGEPFLVAPVLALSHQLSAEARVQLLLQAAITDLAQLGVSGLGRVGVLVVVETPRAGQWSVIQAR